MWIQSRDRQLYRPAQQSRKLLVCEMDQRDERLTLYEFDGLSQRHVSRKQDDAQFFGKETHREAGRAGEFSKKFGVPRVLITRERQRLFAYWSSRDRISFATFPQF